MDRELWKMADQSPDEVVSDMEERKKILVADNEELNLEFLDLMLSKVGFEVERAGDGKAALEKIRQTGVDLVVVNTMMPAISGWEILKAVKNDKGLARVHMILLSDIDNVKERVESYELGAADYITKPFSFPVLVSKIRSVLRTADYFYRLGQEGV